MAKKTERSFRDMRLELDTIVERFEDQDLDVDEAIELYKQGQVLIKEIKQYLDKAENEVKKIGDSR